jgi:hypothetical protein
MVRQRTFKDDFKPVPERWRDIALAKKTIQVWPEWSEITPLASAKRAASSRDELHTQAAETVEMIVPLADENAVGLERVRLVLTAWPYRRLEDITAVLAVSGGVRSLTQTSRGWTHGHSIPT